MGRDLFSMTEPADTGKAVETTGDDGLQEALLACRRRDPRGMERLYEILAPQLFGFLRRMLPRKELAEEALQDTFVNVWRRCEDYDVARGEIRTWIFAIAHHRAIDILRRERHLFPLEGGDPESQDPVLAHDLPEHLLTRQEVERLRECLGRLSREQRHALFLAYYHDYTQEDIARTLTAPLGTVKSWVRRGLLALRRCLEPSHEHRPG